MTDRLNWIHTRDGFAMCREPLADILEGLGIRDTGISAANPEDVQSFYDDWHLFRVTGEKTVYSLLKVREQESDYVPGFSDADDPGVTISFIPFDIALLERLEAEADRTGALGEFVAEFRRVTELPGQRHSPVLQRYFSAPTAQAPYLVAEFYIKKLLRGAADGHLPLPDRMRTAPERVLAHLQSLNSRARRTIFDPENSRISVLDPENPTLEEQHCLLITHTGDPDFNSFAAEVKFHSDALVSWENHIPVLGETRWYSAAIRADMQIEPDDWLRMAFFAPYYDPKSSLVRQQAAIHGRK